jgi:hypothetical protein
MKNGPSDWLYRLVPPGNRSYYTAGRSREGLVGHLPIILGLMGLSLVSKSNEHVAAAFSNMRDRDIQEALQPCWDQIGQDAC